VRAVREGVFVMRLTNRGRIAGALFVSLVCVGPDILSRILFH
jgi:hypothetical protein